MVANNSASAHEERADRSRTPQPRSRRRPTTPPIVQRRARELRSHASDASDDSSTSDSYDDSTVTPPRPQRTADPSTPPKVTTDLDLICNYMQQVATLDRALLHARLIIMAESSIFRDEILRAIRHAMAPDSHPVIRDF